MFPEHQSGFYGSHIHIGKHSLTGDRQERFPQEGHIQPGWFGETFEMFPRVLLLKGAREKQRNLSFLGNYTLTKS